MPARVRAAARARTPVEANVPRMPDRCGSADCGDGKPLDLRPADPAWP
jgi:hypothetical protein